MMESYACGISLNIVEGAATPSLSCWMISIGSSFMLDCLNQPDPKKLLGSGEPLPILTDRLIEIDPMIL